MKTIKSRVLAAGIALGASMGTFAATDLANNSNTASFSPNHSIANNIALPAKKACVSMQGNGERFTALTGQIVQLLERNIEPQVIYGGSSASNIASLIGAILDNQSIANTHVEVNGMVLSRAEKSARILAAIGDISETSIALPGFNNIRTALRSLVSFYLADAIAKSFVGFPDQTLGIIESVAGQAALQSEFFSQADFTAALLEDDFKLRQNMLMEQWVDHADLLYVTPREFINALFTAPSDSRWNPRIEEIKKRYFDMYYSDSTPVSNLPDAARAKYNRSLNRWRFFINLVSEDQKENLFRRFLGLLSGLPFVGYTSKQLSSPFYLLNGEKVTAAYLADNQFAIPSRTIIQSTARTAEPFRRGLIEKEGLENFYQVYFTSPTLAQEIIATRNELAQSNQSFLQYTDAENETLTSLLPAEQFLVITDPTLSKAVKASAAEPNTFRRDPLNLDATTLAANDLVLPENETILSYGGWMEHANAKSIMDLPSCQDADYYVQIANLSQQLYDLQVKVIRPVIEGLRGFGGGENTPSHEFIDNLWLAFAEAQTELARAETVLLDFNWDAASGEAGDLGDTLNKAYDANRKAMFLASYQSAKIRFDEQMGVTVPAARNVIGADLNAIAIRDAKSPEAIDEAVKTLLD